MSPGRVTAADKEPFSARVQRQGDGRFRAGEREHEVEWQRCCDAVIPMQRSALLSGLRVMLHERLAAPAIKLRERDSTRHSRVVRLGVATSTHPSTRRMASESCDEILRERDNGPDAGALFRRRRHKSIQDILYRALRFRSNHAATPVPNAQNVDSGYGLESRRGNRKIDIDTETVRRLCAHSSRLCPLEAASENQGTVSTGNASAVTPAVASGGGDDGTRSRSSSCGTRHKATVTMGGP